MGACKIGYLKKSEIRITLGHWLEKSTPLPVVGVVTNMNYEIRFSFWFHRVQFHQFDSNIECFGTGMYYTCRSCRQRCIKSKLMVAPMAFHLNSASRANPPNRDAIIDWVEKDAVDLGGWERVAIGRHNPSYL